MTLPHFPYQYKEEDVKGDVVDNLIILFQRVLRTLEGTTSTIAFRHKHFQMDTRPFQCLVAKNTISRVCIYTWKNQISQRDK